jgi:uncharacterized Tic20 family protein
VVLTVVTLFIFTLTSNNGKEVNNYEISFFILAITLTCISLIGASFNLVLKKQVSKNYCDTVAEFILVGNFLEIYKSIE